MEDIEVFIEKASGKQELFSFKKLRTSLRKSDASPSEVELIVATIKSQLYQGISSKEIYKKAFSLLKKHNRISASKYSLKKAIYDLGPSGYPFEKLVSALLQEKGYKTKVSVILQGSCVSHEIDVLAEKDGDIYTIECKFHGSTHTVSNVKIPLYINSRFLDVQKYWEKSDETAVLKQGWLITNTRFTEDATNYGNCVGLTMLSWDYPKGKGISNMIDTHGLYPLTTMTSLNKREKQLLIENDLILVKSLVFEGHTLKKLGFTATKIESIIAEAYKLCNIEQKKRS